MGRVKVIGFNHTSFTVSDLDEAIAFFRDCLGFELMSRAPRDGALILRMAAVEGAGVNVAFLQGPGHRIELIEYNAPAGRGHSRPRLCDTGAAHLAVDIEGMDEALEAAAEFGFEPVGDVIEIDAGPNRGSRVVYLRNPDGITVEFLQAP